MKHIENVAADDVNFFIESIAIIGIGLIGGSLAQALKRANCVGVVNCYDSNPQALQKALDMKVADYGDADITKVVENADIIVLATPITTMSKITKHILPFIKEGAIITDVGSTKGSVINSIRSCLGYFPARFVPAHPIAGTEKHGVENSFPSLFENRCVLITPQIENSQSDIKVINDMWQATGARVEKMGVQHHDKILAATSHLPHLLAFSTVDTLANLDDMPEIFSFAAGGFRDFTRISTSDPNMWADICLENQASLLEVLHKYQEKINILEQALSNKDKQSIYEIFKRAKQVRDNFIM